MCTEQCANVMLSTVNVSYHSQQPTTLSHSMCSANGDNFTAKGTVHLSKNKTVIDLGDKLNLRVRKYRLCFPSLIVFFTARMT